MSIFDFNPGPGQLLDWQALDAAYDWIRDMRDCPQDPEYHAEGNVWIHTRMVVEEMLKLNPSDTLLAAALLHDVGKPATTKLENGRWRSRGHSLRGTIMARRILWQAGVAFEQRERICGMIRFHQIPYYTFDRPDPRKLVFRISLATKCDELTQLAEADIRGRICATQQESLDNIELFAEYCREHRVFDQPRAFVNGTSRYEFFAREDRDPDYAAYEDPNGFEVILMAGLPGSGKDTWLKRNAADLPVISLDDIRLETGAAFTGDQGAVIAEAKERARVHLRRREPFAFNATNLTHEFRSRWIQLFTDYKARVRIVYVESTHDRLWTQNRNRERTVPEPAIERMLDRWELPELTESHRVDYVLNAE